MKNGMKVVAAVALCMVSASSLASCGGTKSDVQVIKVQFVPSRDPGELGSLAKKIEPLLKEAVKDEKSEDGKSYEFQIDTGTSYAATTEAMLSDQVDIGFLTASGYAEATIKHPDKVEVLMTSVRKGYKVQVDDYKDDVANQIKAMNGEIEGYEYLGQQSDSDVNWYTSQLCVAKKYYVDKNSDGKIDVKDMAGLKIGRQGQTSGAGYLRPLKYLDDNGMEMVDELDETKTNQIRGIATTGYDVALQGMVDGDLDGMWMFTDVRYANGYNKEGNQYYQDKKIFTEFPCVAITDGIYNDTISARAGLDSKAKEVTKKAFKTIVKEGTKEEEGTGAYYLYNIYSHTGYTDASDSDFDGERDFYNYLVDNDLLG